MEVAATPITAESGQSPRRGARASESGGRLLETPPASIAVIDDEEDIREALQELLEDAGYAVVAYSSAQHALGEMERGRRPDLILLDLMMPGMNGWDFRVAQRKSPTLTSIPVIALSADVSSYAESMNADAYVRKPVDIGRLQTVIEQTMLAHERRDLAAKAVELERVRSLGMLVAGVAHEINNPLTYLLGNLDIATLNVGKLAPALTEFRSAEASRVAAKLTTSLEGARDGAERIESIVKLLSAFSNSHRLENEEVDVSRPIDAAARLAMQQIRGRARLSLNLEPLPPVLANEARLAQVFLNLLINAAHAIEPGDPDHNEIRVDAWRTDDFVTIDVTDTGSGISPDLATRIFEPFYTTKPVGTGTGLGLSISRDIITSTGGRISVESEMGRGSTFRVELPAMNGHSDDDFSGRNRENPRADTSMRVLVVDDEPLIVDVVGASLAQHLVDGYIDPTKALQGLADVRYDLVLCDFSMPQMTGIEFYKQLCAKRPDLRRAFVLMTGAAASNEVEGFIAHHGVHLLHKPFKMQVLSELLDARGGSQPMAQA